MCGPPYIPWRAKPSRSGSRSRTARKHSAWVRSLEEEADAFFAGHEMLQVVYEDLLADQTAEMSKVQEFLGLREQRLSARTARQRTVPLPRAIANYGALKEAFSGTGLGGLLRGNGSLRDGQADRTREWRRISGTGLAGGRLRAVLPRRGNHRPSRLRPLFIRGPRPERLEPGSYFVCLGAAQTFGRFCAQPFPTLLGQRLGYPVLNISHGGAGPSFFCISNERLLHT